METAGGFGAGEILVARHGEPAQVIDAGNEERLVALLRRAARGEPHVPDVLEEAFFALTGRTLRDAIDQAEWIWRKDALQYVD